MGVLRAESILVGSLWLSSQMEWMDLLCCDASTTLRTSGTIGWCRHSATISMGSAVWMDVSEVQSLPAVLCILISRGVLKSSWVWCMVTIFLRAKRAIRFAQRSPEKVAPTL